MTTPPENRHHAWQVSLHYPTPPGVTYRDLETLQRMVMPQLVVASFHPAHGWGAGGDWLWFTAHRRRAVSALWAAAWAHRRVRRTWAAWAACAPTLVPDPVKIAVTRADTEEQP